MCPNPRTRWRRYTDERVAEFLREDVLDGEALAVARDFDRATGGTFFGTDEGDAPSDSSEDA